MLNIIYFYYEFFHMVFPKNARAAQLYVINIVMHEKKEQ